MKDNLFNIGDRVYLQLQEYYVVGLNIKFGYNQFDWVYKLGHGNCGDTFPFKKSSEVHTVEAKECDIWTPERYLIHLEAKQEEIKCSIQAEKEKIYNES